MNRTITLPLSSAPNFSAPATEASLQTSFPALAGAGPQRAVLLVPDAGLYLAFRLLRTFHDAGVAVDLLCPPRHPLAHSRYVRHVCEASDQHQADTSVAGFLRHPARPWRQIIIAHEPSVRRLLTTLDAPALAAWQPGAAASPAREFFLGKFGLPAAAERWGLPLPPSAICTSLRQLCDFGASVGWPIIVKPSHQLGGHGIRKFPNAREVNASGASLAFPLLAQKFIFGRRIVLDLLCSRGRLLAWLASYSTAQRHGPFSYSTGRLFRALPALQPLLGLIARQSQFEGFCGVDCLEENDTGRIYLLEFNPRPTSGWRFSRDCGVDFSPAVAAWLEGAPPSFAPLSQPLGRDIPVHFFPTDLVRCLHQRDWRGLRHWLPGARSGHDVCWDDPGPFLAWMKSRFFSRGN